MRLLLNDLPLIFPYPLIFPEQLTYMQHLKAILDSSGQAILEMPTGTGKTVCLLALVVAYLLKGGKYRIFKNSNPIMYNCVPFLTNIHSFQHKSQSPLFTRTQLIYCTRTVPELQKTLLQLKVLLQKRDIEERDEQKAEKQRHSQMNSQNKASSTNNSSQSSNISPNQTNLSTCPGQNKNEPSKSNNSQPLSSLPPRPKKLLCLGLTAKSNLCVHEQVNVWKAKGQVETECRKRVGRRNLTGVKPQPKRYPNSKETEANRSDVKQQLNDIEDAANSHQCSYYNQFVTLTSLLPTPTEHHSVYTLSDLRKYGKAAHQCPYFTAREALKTADIVVFNYLYLIDPQISGSFFKSLPRDTIVVFDQAHNIDDVCIEAYTVKLGRQLVNGAAVNLADLENRLARAGQALKENYQQHFKALLQQLPTEQVEALGDVDPTALASSVIPERILNSTLFLNSIKGLLQFLRNKLKEINMRFYDNAQFRRELELQTGLDIRFLKLVKARLNAMLLAMDVNEVESLKPLNTVVFFCQLIASYNKGFRLLFQPHPLDGNISDPLLTLACLDCSLAMQPIFKYFAAVVLTSGTMSPISLYPRLLNFEPSVIKSINIEIGRNPISPIILGRTYDQQPLTSEYAYRSEKKVALAYGSLLQGLSTIVPDGILCFFPSYMYMDHILKQWHELGVLNELAKSKLVYLETRDSGETQENLRLYREACDVGRGAIFLAIARGKIAEGVDFQEHYGRCVVMIGFPVQNSHDPVLLERIRYMVEARQLKDKNEFFEFDTMRQCAQCLGRVVRRKTDYGLMILADARFLKQSRYEKLPEWIKKCLESQNINATFEGVFAVGADFFRRMGCEYKLSTAHFRTEQDMRAAALKQAELVKEEAIRLAAKRKRHARISGENGRIQKATQQGT